MDFGRLLGRAFQITLHHRALWLYGFLLALFGGSGGSMNYRFPGGGSGSPGGQGIPPVPGDLGAMGVNSGAMAGLFAGLACIFLFLVVLAVVIQAVSRAALIGMADDVERSGATTVRGGWGYGWSRFAWRNFLIDVLVGLAVAAIAFLLALVFGGAFVALGLGTGIFSGDSGQANAPGIVGLVCLSLLCLLPLAIIVFAFISTWVNLAQRHVVLRDAGVFASLGEAWALFRAHLASLVGLVVILFLIGLVWWFITVLIAFGLGFGLSGVPGVIAYLLTEQTWAGVLAALPGFLLLLAAMAALGTLWTVFHETVWTLAYRELTGLGAPGAALIPAPAPAPPAPSGE